MIRGPRPHRSSLAWSPWPLAAVLLALLVPAGAVHGLTLGGDLHLQVSAATREDGGGGLPIEAVGRRVVLGLDTRGSLGRAGSFEARLELRYLASGLHTLDDTRGAAGAEPITPRAGEVVARLYDLLDGVDLSAGLLRPRWGTADLFSPNDTLSPVDLEDPTRLDRRLPLPAALLAWHPSPSLTMELFVAPYFVPAALPLDEGVPLGETPPLTGYVGEGTTIGRVEVRLAAPDQTLAEQASVAARALWDGPWGTFGLMGRWARDSLPVPDGEVWFTGYQTEDRVDVALEARYPRVWSLGGTWRGTLPLDLGAWVDAALVSPGAARVVASRSQLEALVSLGRLQQVPEPIPSVPTMAGDRFLAATVGVERTWWGWYTNLQAVRGLPVLERDSRAIHQYVAARVRRAWLDGRLEITLDGLWSVSEPGSAALRATGTWLEQDVWSFGLSVYHVLGHGGSTLGRFQDLGRVELFMDVDL